MNIDESLEKDLDFKIIQRFILRNIYLIFLISFIPGASNLINKRFFSSRYFGEIKFYINKPIKQTKIYDQTIENNIILLNDEQPYNSLKLADKCYYDNIDSFQRSLISSKRDISFREFILANKKLPSDLIYNPKFLEVKFSIDKDIHTISYKDKNPRNTLILLDNFIDFNKAIINKRIKNCISSFVIYLSQIENNFNLNNINILDSNQKELNNIINDLKNQKLLLQALQEIDQVSISKLYETEKPLKEKFSIIDFILYWVFPSFILAIIISYIYEIKSKKLFEIEQIKQVLNLNQLGTLLKNSEYNKFILSSILKNNNLKDKSELKIIGNNNVLKTDNALKEYSILSIDEIELNSKNKYIAIFIIGQTTKDEINQIKIKYTIYNLNFIGWLLYDEKNNTFSF